MHVLPVRPAVEVDALLLGMPLLRLDLALVAQLALLPLGGARLLLDPRAKRIRLEREPDVTAAARRRDTDRPRRRRVVDQVGKGRTPTARGREK